jgi:hypothetical protein
MKMPVNRQAEQHDQGRAAVALAIRCIGLSGGYQGDTLP